MRRLRGGRRGSRADRSPRSRDADSGPEPEAGPEYSGPALLDTAAGDLPVTVALSGYLDPIDGKFHWYGRVSAPEGVDLPDPGRGRVFLTLPGGTPAGAVLQERDPWGNLRIVGEGTPPFPLEPTPAR
ncbi:DUF4873 domain-containing protein [Nocardia sp. NPDC005978]|uniref:DUF4873 domain-containing protein n=1 Tax=Nocardia sp. NPDC005978 TaxID=3156725 RepID=UPI0033AE6A4C